MTWLLNRLIGLGVGLAVTAALLVLVGIHVSNHPKPAAPPKPSGEVVIDLSPSRHP